MHTPTTLSCTFPLQTHLHTDAVILKIIIPNWVSKACRHFHYSLLQGRSKVSMSLWQFAHIIVGALDSQTSKAYLQWWDLKLEWRRTAGVPARRVTEDVGFYRACMGEPTPRQVWRDFGTWQGQETERTSTVNERGHPYSDDPCLLNIITMQMWEWRFLTGRCMALQWSVGPAVVDPMWRPLMSCMAINITC